MNSDGDDGSYRFDRLLNKGTRESLEYLISGFEFLMP